MSNSSPLDQVRAAPDLYSALQEALGEVVGHKLFTLMCIDHDRGEAARIHSSHPTDYPVGGRKPLAEMTYWGKIVLQDRQPWIGVNSEDIKAAFFDHELITQLGCASCLNMPVVDEDAPGGPRTIGTVNLLHEAGWYTPEHIAQIAPFAALLVEPYRDWARSID